MLSILYLFYNANLLNVLNDEDINIIATKYIDDIAILVIELLSKKNIVKLKQLYNRILN